MKVYLSADIEGITGTTVWDETEKKHPDYGEFQEQMTAEVAAACEGALEAGAEEIWVKDAHDSARNILAARLPRQARLLRGWSGHPFMMVDGLDSSFQALMMVGYHSRAASGANPLSHSMSGGVVWLKINDQDASEFMIHSYVAGMLKVPVAFLAGDAGLVAEASALVPGLTGVAVKQGVGHATINLHPQLAVEKIRQGVRQALSGDLAKCQVALPAHFAIELRYREHTRAYSASFYPGARLKDDFTLLFETGDYFEVMRLFAFVL